MRETVNNNTDTGQEGGYTDVTEDTDRELRERRRQRRLRRQKRERRKKLMILGATGIITIVVVAGAVRGIAGFISHSGTQSTSSVKETQKKEDSQEVPAEQQGPSAMEQAKLLATQYDYQSAIDLLKKQSDYESNTDMQNAVKEYESDRDSCTSWPLEEVTHVFYHTLIKDTSKAFDGDYKEADYNQVMTTDKFVYLFGRIIPALSLVLSMALRFVPRFLNQLGVIRNGQKAMGRDVSERRLLDRIKYGLQMLSILVTWSLENAIETSDSMRSRGYGLRGRTAFSVYRFTKRDCCLGTLMAGLFAVFTAGCASGAAYAVYDPRIVLAGFTVQGSTAPVSVTPWLAGATYLCFGIFCFLPVMLELYESRKLKQSRKKTGTDIGMTYRQIYEELEQEGKIL